MAKAGGRVALWVFWAIATISTVLFLIVSFITFANLLNVQWKDEAGRLGTQLNGSLAVTFVTPILVGVVDVTALLILIKKTWVLTGTGYSYGFLAASYLGGTFLLLLTGVQLTATKTFTSMFESTMYWSQSNSREYTGAIVMAFISMAAYLAMFAVMMGSQRSVFPAQGSSLSDYDAQLRTTAMSDLPRQSVASNSGGLVYEPGNRI